MTVDLDSVLLSSIYIECRSDAFVAKLGALITNNDFSTSTTSTQEDSRLVVFLSLRCATSGIDISFFLCCGRFVGVEESTLIQ